LIVAASSAAIVIGVAVAAKGGSLPVEVLRWSINRMKLLS